MNSPSFSDTLKPSTSHHKGFYNKLVLWKTLNSEINYPDSTVLLPCWYKGQHSNQDLHTSSLILQYMKPQLSYSLSL
jgi:hypothetical protein